MNLQQTSRVLAWGIILGAGVISIVSRERGTLPWILMMVGALATLFEGPILLQVASRVVGFELSD